MSMCVLWVAAACSMPETGQPVNVLLPAPPAGWQAAFPSLAFRVSAPDGQGSVAEADVPGWTRPAVIAGTRSMNSPVLAWPFVLRGPRPVPPGVLRPAGGLYPRNLRSWNGETVLELRWEDGAAALVLERAAAAGADLGRFNAARLCRYLERAADPWSLDVDAAAQQVARGSFTAWDLEELPARDVEAALGPGSWFLESPFSVPVPARDGVVRLTGVTLGNHRLFSLDGSWWTAQVREKEVLLVPGQ